MTFTWCRSKNQFFRRTKKIQWPQNMKNVFQETFLSGLVLKPLIFLVIKNTLWLFSADWCFQKKYCLWSPFLIKCSDRDLCFPFLFHLNKLGGTLFLVFCFICIKVWNTMRVNFHSKRRALADEFLALWKMKHHVEFN